MDDMGSHVDNDEEFVGRQSSNSPVKVNDEADEDSTKSDATKTENSNAWTRVMPRPSSSLVSFPAQLLEKWGAKDLPGFVFSLS